jgi:predicted TIM-barrel fold metal-dependent hydrolase
METPEILDAHVHLYAPEAAADPAGWGNARGEPGWVACVAPAGRRSIQGWSTPERLIANMDEAGVAACILQGWYWQRQETCELQNGWYQEWAKRYPGRLIAFAAVQPAAGSRALGSLERSLDAGMRGIGELLPEAQGYTVEDPWFLKVVEIAEARRLPLTLHATDPEAGAAAGPATPLAPLVGLARDHPGATFILAHLGGGLAFRGPPGGEPFPDNLYFDTAAAPLLYDAGVYRRAADRVGAGRILYGSDYPLLVHPRRTREPGLGLQLAEIAAAGLEPGERAQVLGQTLRRILARGLAPGGKQV